MIIRMVAAIVTCHPPVQYIRTTIGDLAQAMDHTVTENGADERIRVLRIFGLMLVW